MHIFQKAFDTLLAKVDRLARKIIFLKKKHLKIFNLGKVGGRGNHFFVFYKKWVLSSLNQLFCYWNVFGEKSEVYRTKIAPSSETWLYGVRT